MGFGVFGSVIGKERKVGRGEGGGRGDYVGEKGGD